MIKATTMTKTIEEAAREASVPYCSKFAAHQEPYEIAYTEFLNGVGYAMSLPLSQRLTDEERERVRKEYAECELIEMDDSPNLAADRITEASAKMQILEHIFGKELFGEG